MVGENEGGREKGRQITLRSRARKAEWTDWRGEETRERRREEKNRGTRARLQLRYSPILVVSINHPNQIIAALHDAIKTSVRIS